MPSRVVNHFQNFILLLLLASKSSQSHDNTTPTPRSPPSSSSSSPATTIHTFPTTTTLLFFHFRASLVVSHPILRLSRSSPPSSTAPSMSDHANLLARDHPFSPLPLQPCRSPPPRIHTSLVVLLDRLLPAIESLQVDDLRGVE